MLVKFLRKKLKNRGGYALIIVLFFCAIGLLLLATTLVRSSTNSSLTNRRVQYYDALEASEASTEKVISEMTVDFQGTGASAVSGKMNNSGYHSRVPTSSENAKWGKFQFRDKNGHTSSTEVDLLADWATSPLISQYQGLSGYAATYRVTSYAQNMNPGGHPSAAVQQDLQLATVPVFQFAIFYNMDMEICPGPNMSIRGRVHSNGNLYMQPQALLTFSNDVTASQNIIAGKSPNDPSVRTPGTIVFDAAHDSGVTSMNLPLGTNNSPAAVHAIVELPPNGESPSSQMGQQRLFNEADLIIVVSNTTVKVNGGNTVNGNGANVSWANSGGNYGSSNFISTNLTFYDTREGKTIKVTQIDVGKMINTWLPNQSNVKGVNSIYVIDERTQNSSTEPGIRIIDGANLPSGGLTIATPDPLYVKGNYNTGTWQPAAFVADSINVLSGNWNDANAANSSSSLSSRIATSTEVNAAFLAGIVPSDGSYYSGGVENFPRFLEDWSNKTFTYNGSMVVMYPSQVGVGNWKGTGSLYNIYNPPARVWNFDLNFTNPNKLPPITPAVRMAIRGQWALIDPN